MNQISNLSRKKIKHLSQMSFFIPAYQRGYRWTSQQVIELLEDIREFNEKRLANKDSSWYCLQPIVVVPRDERYDVLDGQQRLTTIFLILSYLNQGHSENGRKRIFDLAYETRKNSKDFLQNQLLIGKVDDSNIDYYFISSAYNTVAEWFRLAEKKWDIDKNEFETAFSDYTEVIWYEVEGKDSIDIFTRLNMGKIPLTNAELVKALFLNSSNFIDESDNYEKIKLKQIEVATEWDKIEYTLQDDKFWYFLNNNKDFDYPTRIELVLNLVADIEPSLADEYATFRYFSDKFQESPKNIEQIKENWKKVKQTFQSLEEWFDDRNLYHKIGFLITAGVSLKEIFKQKENKSKLEFINSIDRLIKNRIFSKNFISVENELENMQYGSDRLRHILLLHNIQTMLDNTQENNKFPFDRFKKEKWDVEHVSAIQEEMPKTIRFQKEWLEQNKTYLINNSILVKEIEGYISQISQTDKNANEDNSKEFEPLFLKILKFFAEDGKVDDTNDISNLVLLDEHTNRSYKNAVFPLKRSKIIERERKGTFVPIATKNVFMKFYTGNVSQMSFWGDNDRNSYRKDIIDKLNTYRSNNE